MKLSLNSNKNRKVYNLFECSKVMVPENNNQYRGIHNNLECIRCGACCVYFRVKDDNGNILKKAGEPCPHLSYEPETKIASCQINDHKPIICREFTCAENSLVFIINQGRAWNELIQIAKNMPLIP